MKKRIQGIILFALSIVLLLVVSSRVSPPERTETVDERERERQDYVLVTPSPEPTPTPTPEPTSGIREILPDVSPTEWYLKLVNDIYILPQTFAPNVVEVQDGQYFDERAADALNNMISAAEAEGYSVYISVAYRPYRTQATLFFGKASQIAWGGEVEYADAEMMARKLVAYPGTSEHQLGLAVDLLDSKDTNKVAEEVEYMPLLRWLQAHCMEFGFIYRYPKNKQDITGWYEPWHFRYVGESAAMYMAENNLCLEEFIALY